MNIPAVVSSYDPQFVPYTIILAGTEQTSCLGDLLLNAQVVSWSETLLERLGETRSLLFLHFSVEAPIR
jgi:hypothetical protein